MDDPIIFCNGQSSKKDEEELKAEKFQFIAFENMITKKPMTWWIRKDRLNRSQIFETLFVNYDPVEIKELQLPDVQNAKELYHLLNWINRDSLVFPCVLSLNRCYELAKNYCPSVVPQLETLLGNKFELILLYTGRGVCLSKRIGSFITQKDAEEAKTNELESCVNPHFSLYIKERDDNKPYN